MFPGDGAHIDQMPQRPHPGPRDRGIGVFATFLKTCGILLVIILCLHSPEHFLSVFLEYVILLSAKRADFLPHGGFLAFETLYLCSPLGVFTTCTEVGVLCPYLH